MSDKKLEDTESKVWHLVMKHLKELKLSATIFYNDHVKLAKKAYSLGYVDSRQEIAQLKEALSDMLEALEKEKAVINSYEQDHIKVREVQKINNETLAKHSELLSKIKE